MRIPFASCLLVLLLASVLLAQTPAPDSVAVRIDDTIEISSAELNTFVDSMLRSQGAPPHQQAQIKPQAWEGAIEQLVLQRLLLRAADQAKVSVEDDEVQTFFKERLPEGMTLADVAEREGLSEKKLLEDIKANLVINKHLEVQVEPVAAPTEEDLAALFTEITGRYPDYLNVPEQVEARHILLKVDAGASEEDRAQARTAIEALRTRILEGGEDFAAIAEEHSDCPSGKRGGGSLGLFGRDQMVKPFEEAAFRQDPGTVGDVVETPFGFHLIEVLRKKEAGKRTIDSEREQLTEMAVQRKKGEAVNAYLEQLKEGVKIEVLENAPVPPPAAPDEQPQRELPDWAR